MRKDVSNPQSERSNLPTSRHQYFSPWANDSWFDTFFNSGLSTFANDSRFISPAIDIDETAEEYIVSADLPGIKKEDISIDCAGNQLTIAAERKSETEGDRKGNRRERFYGTYQRSFTLPTGVDSSKIMASYEGGVLTVHVPKAENIKSRRIQIGEGKKVEDKDVKH